MMVGQTGTTRRRVARSGMSARGPWVAGIRGRSGVVLVWTVVFLLVIILIVGLTLESARLVLILQQLHNGADSAALAGAQYVKFDQLAARAAALELANRNAADTDAILLKDNPANDPDGDVVIGRYWRQDRVFEPNLGTPNAVKVVARRTSASLGGPLPLLFAKIANPALQTIDMDRYAIAISFATTGAGLIALAPDELGVRLSGGVTVDVQHGDIQVNSELVDKPWPMIIDGESGFLDADEINVVGEINPKDEDLIDTPLNQGADDIPDPLCPSPEAGQCIPPPIYDPANDLAPIDPNTGQRAIYKITGGAHVLEPGYYSKGFNINGGNVILKPGIYTLGGVPGGKSAGLVVSGSPTICAMGVMFYIIDEGVVDLGGNGLTTVTPPNAEHQPVDFCDPTFSYPVGMQHEYDGISIFQDRDNHNEASILGTADLDLQGVLYFPRNHVELGGTGYEAGNQLICWTARFHGTGVITVNYLGDNFVKGYRSMLVE